MKGEIGDRQRLFVEEYLKDLNGRRAAIRAGYSRKTSEQQASRLLRNVKVLSALQAERDHVSQRNRLTVDWIVKRLMAIADTAIVDLVEIESGKVNEGINPLQKLALKDFFHHASTSGRYSRKTLKVRMECKVTALRCLMDILGLSERPKTEPDNSQKTRVSDAKIEDLIKKFRLERAVSVQGDR